MIHRWTWGRTALRVAGSGVAAAGREASGLLGIAAAIFLLTALVSAFVLSLRQPWTRIAVRATGSWIAAIGLLSLGWNPGRPDVSFSSVPGPSSFS